MNKIPQKSSLQTTPSTGSRAALRVGLIGGCVLGLSAVAARFTESALLSLFGVFILLGGLVATGYYSVRESEDLTKGTAARTGAVGGLLAGLITGVMIVLVSLVQSLDPMFQKDVITQTNAAMQQMYSAETLAQFRAGGMTVDAIYPAAVAIQLICCGAFLPLMGLGLGAVGGRTMSQNGAQSN